MTRVVTGYLRIVLTIALAVVTIVSFKSRMVFHDFTELAKIVTKYHAKIVDHGHAHDVADHDHNIAFLPPRTPSGMVLPTRTNWALASYAIPDRRGFDLDRPPRM